MNWRRAMVAGLAALVLAASTVAGTTVHDVAHANEQHLAAGPSRQSGPDNLAVDSADRVTAVLLATTPGVNDVAFSPDGKLLASAYGDTVRIWARAAGQPGGQADVSWLAILAFAIAIAVSALAVIITARGIHRLKKVHQ